MWQIYALLNTENITVREILSRYKPGPDNEVHDKKMSDLELAPAYQINMTH